MKGWTLGFSHDEVRGGPRSEVRGSSRGRRRVADVFVVVAKVTRAEPTSPTRSLARSLARSLRFASRRIAAIDMVNERDGTIIAYLEERVRSLQLENDALKSAKDENETLKARLASTEEKDSLRGRREEQEMMAYQRWEAALSPDPVRTRIADTDRLIRRMIKERRTGGEILEAVYDFFFDNAGCD